MCNLKIILPVVPTDNTSRLSAVPTTTANPASKPVATQQPNNGNGKAKKSENGNDFTIVFVK